MSESRKIRKKDELARTYLAAQASLLSDPQTKSRGGRGIGTAADKSQPAKSIKAEFAAATVMLARAVERVKGLARELRHGSPVLTIAVGDAELLQTVGKVLNRCCFQNSDVFEDKLGAKARRAVLLVVRDGTEKEKAKEAGNAAVADALHVSAVVVGIALEPSKHLPTFLVRAADHHLLLEPLDASGIALVIEAVTGSPPSITLEEGLAGAADLSDIMLSVRPDRAPDECIERMGRMVSTSRSGRCDGPGLEELVGYGEARQWGLNFVADLNLWRAESLEWSAIETSLMVFGPPGTGKTKYAAALSKSANLPLIETSVATWNSMPYLSGTLAEMRAVFARAKQIAPSILFCDELDGIGDRANLPAEWGLYYSQIQNLALELFSQAPLDKVVLVCATNYPDRIDAALLRSGRLDRKIQIGLPDTDALVAIFRQYLGKDLKGADLMRTATRAVGRTGADVQAWVRAARGNARRAGRAMRIDDLLHEIGAGRRPPPQWLRHSVAIHEVGHLVGALVERIFEPRELFLNDEGGFARIRHNYADLQTRAGLESYITAILSGRAAEEVMLGIESVTIGSGAGEANDLSLATSAALDLELRFGMGSLGVAQFSGRATEVLQHDPAVLKQVRKRLDRCFRRARSIIEANRKTVTAVASALERSGHLGRESILRLLERNPVRPPVDAAPRKDVLDV